jgi:hopanoid biosynthesis associated radical SAM protein HpnJ
VKKTLFLNPPSFDGFDGGAGSRYQARREVRSFWYPTWLAQPAALVDGSRLIDAPARGLSIEDVLPEAGNYEMLVMHTSTPSFRNDVKIAEAFKAANPKLLLGFVGAHVAVLPESVMASDAIDFVGRNEFDFTIKEIAEGRPFSEVDGISYKVDGKIVHNRERVILEEMDKLPFVSEVYKRDLVIEDYFNGYLLHPYVSFYTGRGCRSKCSFCLWPQTIGGHHYRTRSPEHVAAEVRYIRKNLPQVREIYFDDDTFTDDRPRTEQVARLISDIGIPWSCTAKPDVPYETLKVMKENGVRILLVGYETGSQQILNNIRKGTRIDIVRRFTENCHKLGILIHGTFILGLPGETAQTIEETIRFAKEMNPRTIQISLAAAYPGTELYAQAKANGWLLENHLVADTGVQVASLNYPHLSHQEIFEAVARFYKKFYFRPSKIGEIVGEMIASPHWLLRRLREGVEFFTFLATREEGA